MKTFQYIALSANGKKTKGTIVSENKRGAHKALSNMGLFPTNVALIETKPNRTFSFFSRTRGRLASHDRAILTRQIGVLLQASLSKEDALDAVMSSDASQSTHVFAARAKALVLEGKSLADAFASIDAGFAPYYIAALKAGETAGHLAEVFERLANHLQSQNMRQASVVSALVYPIFVAVVAFMVCALLVVQVAPELERMFEIAKQPLPLLTANILAFGRWLSANAFLALFGVCVVLVVLSVLFRQNKARENLVRVILRMPVFARLYRMSLSAQYLRTLAIVLRSGDTIPNGVKSAADVITSQIYKNELEDVLDSVNRGRSLADAVKPLTFLPPIAIQMIRVGEETADVGTLSDRAADVIENWLQTDRNRLAVLLEPILMILVGAIVLTVILSILLPIFELQSNVSL